MLNVMGFSFGAKFGERSNPDQIEISTGIITLPETFTQRFMEDTSLFRTWIDRFVEIATKSQWGYSRLRVGGDNWISCENFLGGRACLSVSRNVTEFVRVENGRFTCHSRRRPTSDFQKAFFSAIGFGESQEESPPRVRYIKPSGNREGYISLGGGNDLHPDVPFSIMSTLGYRGLHLETEEVISIMIENIGRISPREVVMNPVRSMASFVAAHYCGLAGNNGEIADMVFSNFETGPDGGYVGRIAEAVIGLSSSIPREERQEWASNRLNWCGVLGSDTHDRVRNEIACWSFLEKIGWARIVRV